MKKIRNTNRTSKIKYIVASALLLVGISLAVACTAASPPVQPQDVYVSTKHLGRSLAPRN
jgi:hypothetical protein